MMQFRKRGSILGLFLCAILSLQAQQWTDVTDVLLKNPSFSGNSIYGWTWFQSVQAFNVRLESAEFFNGTFDFYQNPKLPKGHYRLSVQAYFRMASNQVTWNQRQNDNEEITAELYAGSESTPLPSVYDYSFDYDASNNCWSPNSVEYFPNGMESAVEAFGDGAYVTELEFDADGETQLGLRNYERRYSDNWTMFDNFKLEYLGEFNQVLVSNVEFTAPKSNLQVGEEITLTARVTPSNATVPDLDWWVDNPFVITVSPDGHLIARGEGTAHAYIETTDGSEIFRVLEFTVQKAPETTDNRQWVDVTSTYITNPDFAKDNVFDGWEVWRQNGSNTVRAGSMEFWNAYMFTAQQQLTGLPKGTYRLSVQGFHRGYDLNPTYTAYYYSDTDRFAYLFAGDNRVLMPSYYDLRYQSDNSDGWVTYGGWEGSAYKYDFPNTMETTAVAYAGDNYRKSLEFTLNDASNDINIGVTLDDQIYRSGNWCIFSNFKLEYTGSYTKVNSIRLSADNTDLVVNETVQLHADVQPADALVKVLEWSSGNEAVATVNQNGIVKAVSAGRVVITAKATDLSGVEGQIALTVSNSGDASGALIINEIMAANVDEYVSPAYNFDGWIELYNPTNKSFDLTGLYLSDDATNLKKWRLPAAIGAIGAYGYKLVWFDSEDIAPQNAPFKLDVDGGTIYLSDTNGKVMISQTYPQAMERISYARTTDGGKSWGLTSMPTPGASNAGSQFATEQLEAPAVDQDSKLFDGPFTATVTIPAGTTLRYTTDGTLPTLENGYTSSDGIFNIEETTNLRLRLFAAEKLPSRVTTRSYIYRNLDYMLPVVSVVADDNYLYGNELGVLVRGTNGKVGHGQQSPCNWNMNWQRPVNFSYLTADGEMAFNQDVELEMSGGWSRGNSLKSFKLRGTKELGGQKNLFYPFFDVKPYMRNRGLLVRNGGNDTGSRFRDPAMQYIIQSSGLNIDVQSYYPVHEFINGRYIGVLNMREPNNKDFVYANYGWDDDEIDQFKIEPDSGYIQKCGTRDAFNELVSLSEDAANNETYQEICNHLLDIDAYANYMAVEFFTRNWDWPQNNVKGFRHRDDGKFRFVVFDLDNIFTGDYGDGKAGYDKRVPYESFMAKEWFTFDQLYPTNLGRITDSIQFVTIFKNLTKNTDFRRKFVDAVSILGGSVYEPSRVENIIDMLAGRVAPAMQLTYESPWGSANGIKNAMYSRPRGAMNDICWWSDFGYYTDQIRSVQLSSNVEGATLLVNDTEIPTGRFNGYLFAPARLKAVAPAGYVFQGWSMPRREGVVLKEQSTTWQYYDQGELYDNWQSPNYSENAWKSGQAPIGHNNPNVAANTEVDYQTQKSVYYFRTSISLDASPNADDEFWLDYIIDDGFVVYVNGTEAGRYNMRSDNSFATEYAHANPDTGSLQLPTELFHRGSNVIAVEVHNESLRSSDILWDAAIRKVGTLASSDFYATETEIQLPDEDSQLMAVFRSMTTQERKSQQLNPVRINEVSGSNTVYINEYLKKNDWLELYNTTDQPVDVEGMYLTDDVDNPRKYQIAKGNTKANTIIPAHGYLLVWCDKLATTDQALHASFKISGEGGYLILSDKSQTWTDKFVYSAHDGNTTIGRYPDGAADVYQMNVPTIGKANMMTSYLVAEQQHDIVTGMSPVMIASANGFRIRYGSQQLFIKSDEPGQAVVDIYTTDGRLLETRVVSVNNGTARVSVAHLPAGFYVARATNGEGNRVSCKFLK